MLFWDVACLQTKLCPASLALFHNPLVFVLQLTGATIFVDNHTDFLYVYLTKKLHVAETVEAKYYTFKRILH